MALVLPAQVDAMLLKSSRVGHGYAVAHHTEIKKLLKTRGVALEVCPLSNQVLKLVDDLRNHPLTAFMAEALPVTISPDDPAVWGVSWSQL